MHVVITTARYLHQVLHLNIIFAYFWYFNSNISRLCSHDAKQYSYRYVGFDAFGWFLFPYENITMSSTVSLCLFMSLSLSSGFFIILFMIEQKCLWLPAPYRISSSWQQNSYTEVYLVPVRPLNELLHNNAVNVEYIHLLFSSIYEFVHLSFLG